LRQETSFPHAGSSTIYAEAANGWPWTLRLRIPGWTSEATGVPVIIAEGP
jgi:DUF1680 family protein